MGEVPGPVTRPLPSARGAVSALLGLAAAAAGLSAQEPPDTIQVPPDSLQVPVDSAQVTDSLQVPGDTVPVPDSLATDTVPIIILPVFAEGKPAGWGNGVWEWGPEDLLTTRAVSVLELLDQVPGLVLHRGGDYAQPVAVSGFGGAGGRLRIIWDGIELPAMESGVPDLARIGLGGVGRVRVTRRLGETRVELFTRIWNEHRPYTVIEAGTGDLDTNVFRGTFVDAQRLRGSLGVSLDRLDTDGPDRSQPGTISGAWLRYALHFNDRGGFQVQYRRMTSRRGDIYFPDRLTQTDWAARLRYQLGFGLLSEAYVASSGLKGDEEIAEGDTTQIGRIPGRSQVGLRLGWQGSGFWIDGDYRRQGGRGWPEQVLEARAGVDGRRWGGLEGTFRSETWTDTGGTGVLRLSAWSPDLFGFSVFGEWEDGSTGVPDIGYGRTRYDDPLDPGTIIVDSVTVPHVTERSGYRVGARFARGGIDLGAARLRVESDSLVPLGLPMDAEGVVLPGGERQGWEAYGTLPLWPRGVGIAGGLEIWDEIEGEEWRYLPRRSWRGELRFHRTFLPSGNLEVRAAVGVRGRDGMQVPLIQEPDVDDPPDAILLQSVPYYQSWFFHLNIRILTVRAFLRAENLANRLENQDYPGVMLTGLRTMYGIRWTLFN